MRIVMKVRFEIGWGIERECGCMTVIRDIWNVFVFFVHLHMLKIKNRKEKYSRICVEQTETPYLIGHSNKKWENATWIHIARDVSRRICPNNIDQQLI